MICKRCNRGSHDYCEEADDCIHVGGKPDGKGRIVGGAWNYVKVPCACTCKEPLTRTEVARLRKLLEAMES